MKISCEKQDLLEAINAASKAVSAKSSLPALEGLLITAGDAIKISGYDLELGIEVIAAGEIAERGEIVLSARTFGEIVRKLPDDVVTVSADDTFKTEIKCGMAEFSIIGTDPAEFAEIPKIMGDRRLTLPQNRLKSMIRQTVFAVSQNENKPVITGCLFDVMGDELRVVAVDGFRLALRRETLDPPAPERYSFVVPGKTLLEVSRLLSDTDLPVTLSVSKKQIIFELENVVLVSRLLEGEFMNYEGAIPKETKLHIKTDVRAFASAVERASLLISERLKSPVRLKFDMDHIRISCSTPLGRAQDEVAVVCEGDPLEMGFNSRFLLDALKNCECDRVRIDINTALLPMVIRPEEGEDFLFLVLPVRLRSGE